MLFLLNQVAIMYLRSSHCKRMAHLLLLAIERIIVISQNPLWASSEDHEEITKEYACLKIAWE